MKSQNLPKPPALIKTIGPSIILLGLAIGSGELILWPYLAANWGLGLLWGAVMGISFQYLLNTEIIRYSLATGESVFLGLQRISRLIPIWFIFSTFVPWSLPGFSSASAEILVYLIPAFNATYVSIAMLLLTGIFLSSGSSLYKTMERFQKTIILVGLPLVLLLAALLTSQNDWVLAASGLIGRGDGWWFFPEGVALSAFLGAFAYSGAGGNLNLAQSYYVKEKGLGMGKYASKISSLFSSDRKPVSIEGGIFKDTPQNRKLWDRWWSLVTTEHLIVFWGIGLATIILLAVLAHATVFHVETAEGLSFIFAEADAIGARLGTYWTTVFLLLSALMLLSTQVGVLESSSRIISENILLLFYTKGKKVNITSWFYAALWGQILLGVIIYLSGISEPRFLLTLGAMLNGAAMMIAFPLLYWLNTRSLPQSLRPTKLRKIGLGIAFAFFAFFVVKVVTG